MAEWLSKEEYRALPRAEKTRLRNEYIEYKKQVAKQYGPTPDNTYTVDIPGLKDIFKYTSPASENKRLKSERYHRFKTKESPVPSIFNWIPGVITYIDDAQDLIGRLNQIAVRFEGDGTTENVPRQ